MTRVYDVIGVSKVVVASRLQTTHGENRQKVVDWDQNDSQTQKQLAEQLRVSQKAVYHRLPKMGKTQNTGRWVTHELNDS